MTTNIAIKMMIQVSIRQVRFGIQCSVIQRLDGCVATILSMNNNLNRSNVQTA